jgi:hypothetical protein
MSERQEVKRQMFLVACILLICKEYYEDKIVCSCSVKVMDFLNGLDAVV